MTVTPLLAGGLAALCATVAVAAIPLLRDRGPIDRLSEPVAAGGRRGSLLRRLVERLVGLLGPRLVGSVGGRRRDAISHKLDLAGRPAGLTVQRLVGLKGAIAVLAGCGFLFLSLLGGSLPLALLATVMGWYAPDVWIARTGRLRQERIERDLPDFLDILSVTVRAGLGYRLALARVSEQLGGPVAEEMLVALRQMDLGASRRAAFEALRDRNASESLSGFVAAQLQAEELGVPLSEALTDIARDMRRAAHQAARRRAARASPRVSLVVTTLIVPGTMLLIIVAILISSGVLESGVLG